MAAAACLPHARACRYLKMLSGAPRLDLIAGTALEEQDLSHFAQLTWLQHLELGCLASITDTTIQVFVWPVRHLPASSHQAPVHLSPLSRTAVQFGAGTSVAAACRPAGLPARQASSFSLGEDHSMPVSHSCMHA